MKTVREILVEGRARIERGWCRTANARDRHGLPTDPNRPTACMWCITGAADVLDAGPIGYSEALTALARSLPTPDYGAPMLQCQRFNDATAKDRKDVLALFDRAIESTK